FATRLTGIKENEKFQKNDQKNEPGLKQVVDEAKQHHNVKFVYVWHALAGYWGGVKPAAAGMEHYDTALAYQCSPRYNGQPTRHCHGQPRRPWPGGGWGWGWVWWLVVLQ
ncbi:putative galactinol--sucrose galactosyltransferase 2, partial [Quercus suber]